MKPISVWIALALSVTGCAGQIGAPAVADPKGDQRPAWQQQMDQARRFAEAGKNYVLVVRSPQAGRSGSGGVFVFYNNPRPFCYTYMIPGEWVHGLEPNSYRSKDGRAFAGVLFLLPRSLQGVEGATLVERAANLVTRVHEKAVGQPLTGVELIPFDSARPGTWRWRAAPVTQAEKRIDFPSKILVDLSPNAVVQITVTGTADDDSLARRIIEALRTTTDPECYWPVLEDMLKSALGGG